MTFEFNLNFGNVTLQIPIQQVISHVRSGFATCFNERYSQLVIYVIKSLGDVPCQHMGFKPAILSFQGGYSTNWSTESVQGPSLGGTQ